MAPSDSDDDDDDQHNEFTTKAKFIYSHFSELKNPNPFVCQLIKANGKRCEKEYATRKSTNLGVHLRSHNNRAINAKLTEYDKANAEKKRKRDAEQTVCNIAESRGSRGHLARQDTSTIPQGQIAKAKYSYRAFHPASIYTYILHSSTESAYGWITLT